MYHIILQTNIWVGAVHGVDCQTIIGTQPNKYEIHEK